MRTSVCTIAAALLLLLSPACFSESLASPAGDVILTLSGKITRTNAPGEARFDRAMLEALPQHHFNTTTPWTEDLHRYDGVLLQDLLAAAGAQGTRLLARALNDYHATIELAPLAGYPILVAMQADGRPMRVRDKGPLWILHPMTDHPELNTKQHQLGMVWQLTRLVVE